jgi:hypothetical protein
MEMTLDDIRKELGDGAQTIGVALNEVQLCPDASDVVGWIDVREKSLTVYLLSNGVLHVVRGARDAQPDQANINAKAPTECTYSAGLISAQARWSVKIKRTISSVGLPEIIHIWTFRLGKDARTLEIQHPPPDSPTRRGSDPTSFANALVTEILEAQRQERAR